MTPVITLRDPILMRPEPRNEPPDGLMPAVPREDEDGHSIDWSYRGARRLQFLRWRVRTGDLVGDTPVVSAVDEIDRDDNGRNER